MQLLQTTRPPVLPFLLVSFFLLLYLSHTHSQFPSSTSQYPLLHYLTLPSLQNHHSSFYSTHSAIHILKRDNRVICRVYHVCHLKTHYVLPSSMKPYTNLLRSQCGLTTPLLFSSRPLNKLNQSFNHDWIAPNTPYQQLNHHIRSYLPSFYSPSHLHLHHFYNTDNNTIKTSCFSPSQNRVHPHPHSPTCQHPPEPIIQHPAILLDHLDHPKYQHRKQHLINTYQYIFKQRLEILHPDSVNSTSALCFRSIISSPEITLHSPHQQTSSRNNVDQTSEQDTQSLFQRLFKTISKQFMNASLYKGLTLDGKNDDGDKFNHGRIGTINATDFKDESGIRSLRKLLADKTAHGKRGAAGKGGKKNRVVTEYPSMNSAATIHLLRSNDTTSNQSEKTVQQDAVNIADSLTNEDQLPQTSGKESSQGKRLMSYMRDSSDDADLESNDDGYLPTFQYLLDYHPDS